MINIVLGLAFGDEGKGICTSLLCEKYPNPIVIRFNGGQQAGHTVVYKGIRHVFSNFGSGSLQGVPTYFSEHTCFYLNTIKNEKNVLLSKGINPVLYIHPKAVLTTPYDVHINKQDTLNKLHGTVGLGIATTFRRNLNSGYKLIAHDLLGPKSLLLSKLKYIKNYYNLSDSVEGESEFLEIINTWRDLFKIEDYFKLTEYDSHIFEGAQGILLDMDHGNFPHVTYSNTTSKNAMDICNKYLDYDDINIWYTTRCYQTRHGNGYMSNYNKIDLKVDNIETNVNNPWQGEFKISEIDYELINWSIETDFLYRDLISSSNLLVTCLDQRPGFKFDYSKINCKFENIVESSNCDTLVSKKWIPLP